MADTAEFPTLDAGASPIGFTISAAITEFATLDAGAAPIPASDSLGAVTLSFPTLTYAARPGRFRAVEG